MLRLLTDDELDHHPDPCAVLQSWLDALHHLRQLPADEVLTRTEPHIALPHLLAQCGTQPERWHALLKALDYGPTDEEITFGQLLDLLSEARTQRAGKVPQAQVSSMPSSAERSAVSMGRP
ncbi:hypothetical protein AB0B12_26200 [Streptomyces sp. NPDC044780]|uniref:hypothetical protein n=1 Tax=unclassified Streptomyces TaxID=2593676 RepID=UPI0033F01CC8